MDIIKKKKSDIQNWTQLILYVYSIFNMGGTYIQYLTLSSSGTLAKNSTRGHFIKRIDGVKFMPWERKRPR